MNTFPKPAEVSTEWCKEKLLGLYPRTKVTDWKRISKKNAGSAVIRIFEYSSGVHVEVVETQTTVVIAEVTYRPGLHPTPSKQPSIPAQLKKAAAKIRHCGDYGSLWYNAKLQRAWWTAGDADGEVLNGYTDIDVIKQLLKVPGVVQVDVEAECDPDTDNEAGWRELGNFGITLGLDSYSFHGANLREITPTSIIPGFQLVQFAEKYAPQSSYVCYARDNGTSYKEVFSFYHQCILHIGPDNTYQHGNCLCRVDKVNAFVKPLDTAYVDAMNDVYKALNLPPI